MKLEDDSTGKMEAEESNKHVLITKEQLKEQNKISYRITLKSTMVCKSPQGNRSRRRITSLEVKFLVCWREHLEEKSISI